MLRNKTIPLQSYEKLELIPLITWENAQSGYGYMEFGHAKDDAGAGIHAPFYGHVTPRLRTDH
jgi:hypothetical protein